MRNLEGWRDSYFTFCFVRNPWDRAVSLWMNCAGDEKFEGFLKRLLVKPIPRRWIIAVAPQSRWMAADGKVQVDYAAQFENYDEEIAYLVGTLELPTRKMAHLRRTERDPDYKRYYSQEALDLVNRIYQADIELLDYEY